MSWCTVLDHAFITSLTPAHQDGHPAIILSPTPPMVGRDLWQEAFPFIFAELGPL